MSWLTSWLHPERGYKAGQEELDKYYQDAQGQLQPYNQQGQEQYGNLNNYINTLMDPQALQDKWASGYKESEAAKNMEGLAQQHGLDAASSMGLMGSNTALGAIQAGTSGIAAQDRQNYLNDLMEKYKMGAGLSQGIYGTGANAAGQMGQNAMNMGQNSAQMQLGKTNAQGELLGGLLGSAGGLGGGLLSNYLNSKWNPMGGNSWNNPGQMNNWTPIR
jgi:hypothetical protein